MSDKRQDNIEETLVDVGNVVSPEDERVADLMSHTIDISALATAVTKQKAADAADTLEDLDDLEAAEVIELMEDQSASDALAEMETPLAVTIIEDLIDDDRAAYSATLLSLMAPDDAVSILRSVDEKYVEPMYSAMAVGDARILRQLRDYEEESAAEIGRAHV